MNNDELIRDLRTHIDQNIDCDNCSLKDMPNCFNWLNNETIAKLEGSENNGNNN